MRLKDFPEKSDAKAVWLAENELEAFIEQAENSVQRIAFLLMARCGLRRSEVIQITPVDVHETDEGHVVRVWEDYSKSENYRQPPAPRDLVNIADTVADMDDVDPDDSLVGHNPDDEGRRPYNDNTVRSWVKRAAQRMHASSGDNGWLYLTPHDLRRTWGRRLLEMGVLPAVVMDWGGWSDWTTFREHYLTELSPEAIKQERKKVSYLEDSFDDRRGQQSASIVGGRSVAGGGGPPSYK